MNDRPAESSPNWQARLAYENLAMSRGMAQSTDSATSPKARKFSKTADKVWAGGKNNVLVGGAAELEIIADRGSLVSHYEPGHPNFDGGNDTRVAEEPEDLFDDGEDSKGDE